MNEHSNITTTMVVGDVIFRIESTRSLNFVRSSVERLARVSHRLLEILEFLEGEYVLNLVGCVAAAIVSPQIYFYLKFWAPPHHFLLGLIVKFLSLAGLSSFHFSLKMYVSRFISVLFSFGLSRRCLVYWSKKRKIFVLQSCLFEEGTN